FYYLGSVYLFQPLGLALEAQSLHKRCAIVGNGRGIIAHMSGEIETGVRPLTLSPQTGGDAGAHTRRRRPVGNQIADFSHLCCNRFSVVAAAVENLPAMALPTRCTRRWPDVPAPAWPRATPDGESFSV